MMSIDVTPHLNFDGEAAQALEFYRDVFGGELSVITYAQMGSTDPAGADRLTWGQVASDSGFRIMAYDVYPGVPYDRGQAPFFVSVRGTDTAELTRYWEGLAVGATIVQQLGPSDWAPLYGQLVDRFGVTWVLDIAVAYSAV